MRYLKHILILAQLKSYMGHMFKLLRSHVLPDPRRKTHQEIYFVYLDNENANAFLTQAAESFLNVAQIHSFSEVLPYVCVCVCVCLSVCV